MTRRHYTNLAPATTLTGSISAGATGANLASLSGYPVTYPYTVAIDRATANEELVLVTNSAGNSATITRAYGGTTAKSHDLGATWEHVVDATDADEANSHVNASTSVHSVTGSVVGTTDTQTLTNKTISSSTNLSTSTDVALTTKAAGSGTAAQIKSLDSAGSTTLFQVARDGAVTATSNLAAADVVLVKGPTSHSGRLLDLQNSSGAHLIAVSAAGSITHKPTAYPAWKFVPPDGTLANFVEFKNPADSIVLAAIDSLGDVSASQYTATGGLGDHPFGFPADASKFFVDNNGVIFCKNTWTSYTPAWTSTGSAPSLGNGTVAGQYFQLGKFVQVWGKLTVGTTTTNGTGSYRLSLPVTADTGMTASFGPIYYRDFATADYVGVGTLISSTTFGVGALTGAGTNNVWTATSPATPANGDSITWSFAYVAA